MGTRRGWDRIRRIFELPPEEDVDRELEFHLAMRAEELEAEGWSGEEAREEAARLLGDRGSLHETMYRISARDRKRRHWSALAGARLQDVRFALRTLRRSLGFSLTVVAILSLAIGANVSIFSAANAALLQPLPFGDPHELFMLYETNPDYGWTDVTASPANLLDWSERVSGFGSVSAYADFLDPLTLVRDGRPSAVGSSAVMGNFFDVLGVQPLIGRAFTDAETWDGAGDVAILSHGLWTREFGADPGIIGRTIGVGEGALEVVGVMPPGFTYPNAETEVWIPIGWARSARSEPWFRRAHFMRAFARLAPGASAAATELELEAVASRLEAEYPATNTRMGAGMSPIREFIARDVEPQLLVLLGAVGVLLLLAAANVANLVLVRARSRLREVRIRAALGAGRGRLLGQLITEGAILAAVAGGVGLALGWLGIRGIARIQPLGLSGLTDLQLDFRVLLFTVGVSGLCALVASAGLAWSLVRNEASGTLGGSTRGSSADRGSRTLARGLVAFEVAAAVVLVASAGLMTRSYTAIRGVDPGFTVDPILAAQINLPESRYPEGDQVVAFHDRLLEALEARGGIERAGTVEALPLSGPSWTSQFQAEDWPPDRIGFEVLHRRADPGYFEAMDIPLLRGRMFAASDRDGPLVVLVNQTFAQEHFPEADPIGHRIAFTREATPESTWYEIIGVVGDQHQESPTIPARAEVFESRLQEWGRESWVVLRSSADPMAAVEVLRATLAEIDPLIPVVEVRPLSEVWAHSVVREQLVLSLLLVFGVIALVLAMAGVYGVTAEATRARTREIGIRMALGAGRREVTRLVVIQGLGVVAVGLGIGVVAALLTTRALASFLFELSPGDPATLVLVTILLALAATMASYLPVRRAVRLDPTRSLRAD